MSAVHGVVYPPDLLSSLAEPAPHVRLLPSKEFEQLHLSHILAHPQDHVLFPFLHGLEGDNEAQNSFFATAPNAHETHIYTHTQHPRVKVPKYRGLVCVVCEDDLEADGDVVSLRILRRKNTNGATSAASSPSSSMYSSSSESFEDDDEDFDIEEGFPHNQNHDIQVGVAGSDEGRMSVEHPGPMSMPLFHEHVEDKNSSLDPNNQSHMHPISHRTIHPPAPTPIALPSSVSSSSTSASSSASFAFDNSIPSVSPVSDATSISSNSLSPEAAPELARDSPKPFLTYWLSSNALAVHDVKLAMCPEPKIKSIALPPPAKVTDPAAPPLLTGTFRPKELLRRVKTSNGDFEWEFVPAKVPDGISLRNFGIQVPIYATISDIVVYSPKGASTAAITLAKRFVRAIELKRQERLRSLDLLMLPDDEEMHGLMKYNVFVLDAPEDTMRKDLSHLMMRVCVEPVSGGLFGRQNRTHGAHTDGPDGHVVEQSASDPQESSSNATNTMDMDVDRPLPASGDLITQLCYNTVDFAQREKEEMRDLTKASEIISLFPTSLTDSPPSSPSVNSRQERSGSPQQRHRSHSSASSHHPYRSTRPSHLQFLPQLQPPTSSQQNFSFSPPLNSNLEFSSTSIYFDPAVGQVFLGNSSDVPLAPEIPQSRRTEDDPFDYEATNNPKKGLGYDICIECHDLATFPSAAHLRAAEEHLSMLDLMWSEQYERQMQQRLDNGEEEMELESDIPPRPPPHANAVIHLTLPSSPTNTQATMSSLMPVLRFLEKWLRPVVPPTYTVTRPSPPSPPPPPPVPTQSPPPGSGHSAARRWSSVASFMPSFGPFTSSSSSSVSSKSSSGTATTTTNRNRSLTSPSSAPIPAVLKPKPRPRPSRPLKVLMYSSDGYTESSVPALSLLMAIKGLNLPEAYLDLQVAKRRSFFVYNNDLGILRRVEARLKEERERTAGAQHGILATPGGSPTARGWPGSGMGGSLRGVGGAGNRPAAKSVSFATAPLSISGAIRLPSVMAPPQPPGSHLTPQQQMEVQEHAFQEDIGMMVSDGGGGAAGDGMDVSEDLGVGPGVGFGGMVKSRPRAKTSPWLPSTFSGDHQMWFNDPRFDGSFPSRVLPFLYLGNLNHATNAYMLHALGITHVVSVGECALVPPSSSTSHGSAGGGGYMTPGSCGRPAASAHFVTGKGPGMQGSLWIEERERRIKVLDIKGVCDDGIDTLEPQLEPICDWIDKARLEGGQVLVHCRVGVSRSATVTIAYVMKYLNLPLVDAYLIVRSRRLSVLIQPNMRLLYNLCGWEIKLAKERAGGDEGKLKQELSRTLSWPYLAKEVHALNEKYLH
ncbi:hypothetical protein D9756_003546 [Leucocoprinus leucothites]|uniref:Uncharacterized protein n=1 Tax=Leucocoprinus leucothites TaxID=201217 RepID=A0A8H5G6W3_9AGAR|nr:hypothetical protein D9756_003546 [Leucoagaricus leucothites]